MHLCCLSYGVFRRKSYAHSAASPKTVKHPVFYSARLKWKLPAIIDRESDTLGLFSDQSPAGNLTVFRAELLNTEQTAWPELFAGFTSLKAITFSSSLEFLLRLTPQFDDVEIVFGSERILSKEHYALTQATQAVEAYGFSDALADQKIFTEALAQYLGKPGQGLLVRVLDGSLRFRLLRKRPSHEKLYLLSGGVGHRVITGSANLSAQAFEGRQREIYVSFEGERAWFVFDESYRRDWAESAPVDADLIVAKRSNGATPPSRTEPIDLNDVPIARVLKAGVVIREEPPRAISSDFSGAALRDAEKLGAELRDLSLPKSRTGQTIIDAGALVKAIRQHQARPVADPGEDRVPRAEILFSAGQVILNDAPWLSLGETIPAEEVRKDAKLIVDYIQSFSVFFGDAAGAVDAYWAFSSGSTARPPLRTCARPRFRWGSTLGLSRLCGSLRPLERRQNAVHEDRRAFDVRHREDDSQRPVHRHSRARLPR